MKIVAITNIKGGVGKTTTAVNLAFLCAASGRRTVLWDLDSQGAASYILRCEARQPASAKKMLAGDGELLKWLMPSGYDNLDVLPADLSNRHVDRYLSERKHPTERLLKISRALKDSYDMLIMDCPAGLSLLSENALRAADAVVVPMTPTPLALRMMIQLKEFLVTHSYMNMVLLPFFSMVDGRRSLHRELVVSTRLDQPGILQTELPYCSEIERMTVRREPLTAYAADSEAGACYASLWREIDLKLKQVPLFRAMRVPAATPTAL